MYVYCSTDIVQNSYENSRHMPMRWHGYLSGTAERNLEWGGPSSRAERAIHLEGSERIGPEKF